MKNKILIGLMCLLLIVLAGCASSDLGNGYFSYLRVPVRNYLASNQNPKRGYGAYGYLLFAKRPSESDYRRYERICDLFRRQFQSVQNYPNLRAGQLMITYWLVDSLIFADTASCTDLIEHYDYVRSNLMMSSIKKQGVPGPLLIAWTTDQSIGIPEPSALILDLSKFSDEDLDLAFDIWKDRISRDPEEWNNGFTAEKAFYGFYNLIQKYGQQIVEVFKGEGGKM